jgi:hypothetical protein
MGRWHGMPRLAASDIAYSSRHGMAVACSALVRTGTGAASRCRLFGGAAHETIDSTLLRESGRRSRLQD